MEGPSAQALIRIQVALRRDAAVTIIGGGIGGDGVRPKAILVHCFKTIKNIA
jgi:hypothetical protein